MAGGIIAAAITAHVPRMGIEDKAPDFQRGLIAGSKAMGEALRGLKPDLFVGQTGNKVGRLVGHAIALVQGVRGHVPVETGHPVRRLQNEQIRLQTAQRLAHGL